MQRILISAAHKSSGKTTLSLGLCAALNARGLKVQPYKKGPDYIDPMWLSRASDRDCHNLDFQTMTDDEMLATVSLYSNDADISLIEGNKGLYDGVAIDGSNSNAAVAELTQSPVVLVIDTLGMTRGIAPLLLGYQAFNNKITIAGVILNKVGGPRHEKKLRDVIKQYTDITVIGAVPRLDELNITERHLGLIPSNEATNTIDVIAKIAAVIEKYVNLDLLLKIAATAKPLPATLYSLNTQQKPISLKVGIARDAAFGFYYPGDLNAFRAEGVELVEFDTLNDKNLPEVDGLFIGGGFPESWMTELEANVSLRKQIKEQIESGLPAYAECGGLMYLSKSISWDNKQSEMVGVIDADIIMNKRPQGRGYVCLKRTHDFLWPEKSSDNENEQISAHEFHYSGFKNLESIDSNSNIKYAYEMKRGSGISGLHDGLIYKNLLANYAHLRDTSRFHWVSEFVEFIRQVKS
ncbi:MAG: cobyrinate a,c-diamide synthase [Gammaproteobacteria bacterium]|nr:cobyrinate a,c-diamide synthase [Gammaproteobacteria bacterium]MCW8986870.1 cobyrinate a,c-diamide synthase [Gammaproteobacteria bacterium]